MGTPVFPNLGHQETVERLSHPETVLIWKEEHFEQKEKEWEQNSGNKLYDRTMFEKDFYEMFTNHNRDEGTWSTVEHYFNTFCKKD